MPTLNDPIVDEDEYDPVAPTPWYKRPAVWLAVVWTVELTLLVVLNA